MIRCELEVATHLHLHAQVGSMGSLCQHIAQLVVEGEHVSSNLVSWQGTGHTPRLGAIRGIQTKPPFHGYQKKQPEDD